MYIKQCAGRDILFIGGEKYQYTAGYYTANKWADCGSLVLGKSVDFSAAQTSAVLFSIATGEETTLVENNVAWDDFVVCGGYLYHCGGRGVYRTGIKTRETVSIASFDGEVVSPHITSDGKYLSVMRFNADKTTSFFIIETETGACTEIFRKRFAMPFYMANHGMVCPTGPQKLFFAHEGTTEYVSNRLWLVSGEYKPAKYSARSIARQSLGDNGDLGDCFGHEMWSPDGKGIYFVKYICSPSKPAGICYYNIETNERRLIASAYGYWHVGVSPDGKKLVADTQTRAGYSEIVSVDLESGREELLHCAKTTWTHPCHPHPQYSPDSSMVSFTTVDDSGKICAGIILPKKSY